MISFRYHIVSLIAVFFAMAIGVVIGTTVINEQLVEGLENQRNRNRAELAAERERTAALESELRVWDQVAKSTFDPAMKTKLAGKEVVLLAAVSETVSPVSAVVDGLEAAGATVAGRITFTSRWALGDTEDRTVLGEILGTNELDPGRLLAEAARALAARLRQPGPARDADVLERLAQTEFVKVERGDTPFPSRGAAFVYVVPAGDAVPSNDRFAAPLLSRLADAGPVAVAEPLDAEGSLADLVSSDGRIASRVSSVDHIDTEPGMYALVIALADVFAGRSAGHYGTGEHASGVIPG